MQTAIPILIGWLFVYLGAGDCRACMRVYEKAYCIISTRVWKVLGLNHWARTCNSRRIVTRCRFTNWPMRCERGGRTVHFLSINLISFRRSRGIVFFMASPTREMDSAGRQWNTAKDARNVRDFSVKRLPSGGARRCMPQQTRHAGVCADWEQKPRSTRSPAESEQPSTASVIGQIRLGLKNVPRWRCGAIRLAPTQWPCGSNSTTAFAV